MARKKSETVPTSAAPLAYEDKHIELLRAAAGLFAKRGFHDSSIRDLARITGRSLSGLYYYFSGKEELLFQIQHHCYSTLLATVQKVLTGEQSPREQLLTFISHHLAYFRHSMDEMKVLAHEDVTLSGEYGRRILELKRGYSQILIDIVTAYEEELPDRLGHPTPEVAAFLLFGAMNWLYTWPRRLRNLPAEELAEAVAQVFLCGYPGCSASAIPGIRESLVCPPRDFWRKAAS